MEKQKVFIPVDIDKELPNGNRLLDYRNNTVFASNNWLKELEGYFFTPEEANKIFGLQEAWPLVDVLKKLTEASDILLKQKNYDGHGWEEIYHATEKAKQYIKSLKY